MIWYTLPLSEDYASDSPVQGDPKVKAGKEGMRPFVVGFQIVELTVRYLFIGAFKASVAFFRKYL